MHKLYAGIVRRQFGAIFCLQCRTGQHGKFFFYQRADNDFPQCLQPFFTVGIGQRNSPAHFGHIFRRMKIVAFVKNRAGFFGEQLCHRCLAAAGHAHENQNGRTLWRFAVHTIFSFGKSCESTRPTGSFFVFTTMRSSMLRSLKILSASTASAFSQMQTGRGVITFFKGSDKRFSFVAMCRRKSPSVKTPASFPRAFTTARLPDLACVITNRASLTDRFSAATALRFPVRMMSPTLSSMARPIAPFG